MADADQEQGQPERFVVLLCGPPGAGKTTAARESGLVVLDRDDACWESDAQFTNALASVGDDPHARAVVIRSGATTTARAKTAGIIGATHVYMVLLPKKELARRVVRRGRPNIRQELAAVGRWYSRFDRDDGTPDFPGWEEVTGGSPRPTVVEMQRRLHTTREEDCTDAVLQDLVCRVCQAALHRPRPSMMGP